LLDGGQRCTHHGFRAKAKFLCALRNAYKLKHWLVQNSGNSSYNSSVLNENCGGKSGGKSESDNGMFAITNQNFEVTRNTETWRNNTIKKEEEEEKTQSGQAKNDYSKRKKKNIFPKSSHRIKTEATLTLRKRRLLFPITPLYIVVLREH